MIFKRKLYNDMLQWKHESGGQTALLIKGARRVGKSTLARTFAEKEYKSYIAIDFTSCKQEIRDLFEDILFLYLQPIVTQYLVCNKSEIWP